MSDKINVWCAWHPEHGWLGGYGGTLFAREDFDGALEELKEAFEDDFDKANCASDVRINLGLDFVPWIRAKGWQIKPVKILTMAEYDRLIEIEKWARRAHGALCAEIDFGQPRQDEKRLVAEFDKLLTTEGEG